MEKWNCMEQLKTIEKWPRNWLSFAFEIGRQGLRKLRRILENFESRQMNFNILEWTSNESETKIFKLRSKRHLELLQQLSNHNLKHKKSSINILSPWTWLRTEVFPFSGCISRSLHKCSKRLHFNESTNKNFHSRSTFCH